jgi:hypothetical protein
MAMHTRRRREDIEVDMTIPSVARAAVMAAAAADG